MKIIFFIIGLFVCNSAYSQDNATELDKLGQAIDECRSTFLSTNDKCSEKGTIKCHYIDMERNNSIQACYKQVFIKTVIKYYPENKQKMLKQFDEYTKSILNANLALYSESIVCQEGCGLFPHLLANQATTRDVQSYIVRMLDYLNESYKQL